MIYRFEERRKNAFAVYRLPAVGIVVSCMVDTAFEGKCLGAFKVFVVLATQCQLDLFATVSRLATGFWA